MNPTIEHIAAIVESLHGAGFAWPQDWHIWESHRSICANGSYTAFTDRDGRSSFFTVRWPKGRPMGDLAFSLRFRYQTGAMARYHGDAEYIEDAIAEAVNEYLDE